MVVPGNGASAPDIALTRAYLQFLRDKLGSAVRQSNSFDEAFAEVDWSHYASPPIHVSHVGAKGRSGDRPCGLSPGRRCSRLPARMWTGEESSGVRWTRATAADQFCDSDAIVDMSVADVLDRCK